MHIVIFGSGGVGGSFGGHLVNNGADVTFIARGAHLAAMQADGLQIQSEKGNFVVNPVKATDNPRSVKNVDVILVCTKTWQVPGLIDDLKAMMGPDTFVVPLVNSVEATDILIAGLGVDRVLGGLTYTVSYVVGPGIVHSGGMQQIIFGEVDHSQSSRAEKLAQILNATGVLRAETSTEIQARQWEKFIWISSASAVGAVTRMAVGEWRDLPQTRILFKTLAREAFAIAAANGIILSEEKLQSVYNYVDKLSPGMTTSMQRDIMAGKHSELMQQIGYVVRKGDRLDVNVPVSAAIYAALLPQELAAQKDKN